MVSPSVTFFNATNAAQTLIRTAAEILDCGGLTPLFSGEAEGGEPFDSAQGELRRAARLASCWLAARQAGPPEIGVKPPQSKSPTLPDSDAATASENTTGF